MPGNRATRTSGLAQASFPSRRRAGEMGCFFRFDRLSVVPFHLSPPIPPWHPASLFSFPHSSISTVPRNRFPSCVFAHLPNLCFV